MQFYSRRKQEGKSTDDPTLTTDREFQELAWAGFTAIRPKAQKKV